MRPTMPGMRLRGRVGHCCLVRTTAVTREMIALERITAVEARGLHPSLLPVTEWVGIGLAPPAVLAPIRNPDRRRNDGWQPSQPQWDWDEDDWSRHNELSRRREWSGR